jgi:MFS family permease
MSTSYLSNIKDKTVVIISLITAVCLLGNSMLYVTLPLFWQEVGLTSLWEVGVLLSINRIVRLPLNAVIGWLYSKITIRLALAIAVFFAAIATLGYGVFTGFGVWLLLRVFWGAAWSLLKLGGFFTVLMEAKDNDRGRLLGKYNGLHRLGDFLGMLVGGYLTGVVGFRVTLLLFGFIILLSLPISIIYAPNYKVRDTKIEGTILDKTKCSFPFLRVIFGGVVIAMIFEGVIASTLSLLVESHYREGIFILGMSMTIATLSGFLQGIRWLWEPFLAPLIGSRSDEKGNRKSPFLLFLFIGSIALLVATLNLSLPIWILVILILMLTATALVTLSDSLASDLAQKNSSIKTMTIYTIALDVGAALGPFVSYQLLRIESGLFLIYLSGSVLLIIVALLWNWPLKKLEASS